MARKYSETKKEVGKACRTPPPSNSTSSPIRSRVLFQGREPLTVLFPPAEDSARNIRSGAADSLCNPNSCRGSLVSLKSGPDASAAIIVTIVDTPEGLDWAAHEKPTSDKSGEFKMIGQSWR